MKVKVNDWVRGSESFTAVNRGQNYYSDLRCYTHGAIVLTMLQGNVVLSDEIIKELYNLNTLISYIDAEGNASLRELATNAQCLNDSRYIEHALDTVVYHALYWEGCEHPLFMAYGGDKDNEICNSVVTAESAKIPVYYIDGEEIVLELVEVEAHDGVLYPTRVIPGLLINDDLADKRYDPSNINAPYIENIDGKYKLTKAFDEKFFPEEYEEIEVPVVAGIVKLDSEGNMYQVINFDGAFPRYGAEEYRHWRWNEGTREECLKTGMNSIAKNTLCFDLDRKILRDLRDNKGITISYINDDGHGEIREVANYPEIQKLIDKVEQEYNVVIYHCIDWADSEFPVFLGYSAGWSGYNITSQSSFGRKGYLDKIEYQMFYFDGKEFGNDYMTVHSKDGALFLADIFPDFYPEVKPTPKNEHRLPGRYKYLRPYECEYFKIEKGKLTYKKAFDKY